MKFKNIKLFIFDMDGLVFETERLYLKFLPESISELGFTANEDILQGSIGMNMKSTRALYLNHYGKDFPFETLSKLVHKKLMTYNEKNGLDLCPNVLELLSYLKERKLPCVIASSSNRDMIQTYLKRNNIEDYFVDIYSGDEVTNGKPDPEIFLLAAKKQNISPDNCMVFEDSYNGIKAAHSAKMKAIMVPNILQPNDEMKALADLILDNIYMIKDYLE